MKVYNEGERVLLDTDGPGWRALTSKEAMRLALDLMTAADRANAQTEARIDAGEPDRNRKYRYPHEDPNFYRITGDES